MKVDVVICTKDRPHMMPFAIQQARKKIPLNNLIVVDGSETPAKYEGIDRYIHAPTLRLGAARQKGLIASEADIIIYLDDDLILAKNWFDFAVKKLLSDNNIAAVSGQIIFGYGTDKAIEQLCRCIRTAYSGGCMLMDRKKVVSIGGWDPSMHWGEDTELYYHLLEHGFKWEPEEKAMSYHPMTLRHYLQRADAWAIGLAETYKRHHNSISLLNLLMRRFGAIVVRPILLAITAHPKLLVYYSLERVLYLHAFTKTLKSSVVPQDPKVVRQQFFFWLT